MQKVFLGKAGEVPPGRGKTFLSGGKRIFVVNLSGQFKAYVNYCPHQGGVLRYDGRQVQCTWHGAQFDAATGMATKGPAAEGSVLEHIDLTLEGDDLYWHPKEKPRSLWADDF
jgi:cytochrome b6-f complex iron-sulfur subunit